MRRFKWIIALPIAIVLLATAGTWTYIHILSDKAPAPLTLEGQVQNDTPSSSAAAGTVSGGTATNSSAAPVTEAPDSFDGTWIAATGSQAGYRAKEVLFGQSTEAVGRTANVDGALTIAGTAVKTADISIDLASVTSDKSQRDNQFRGRIMSVTKYPTATFKLTQPIEMGSIPGDGATVSFPATGELAVHGVTKAVTITVTAKRTGGTIQVSGSIPVVFGDYGIPDPSFGPASVEDHGTIEFLVSFVKSANNG